LIGIMEPSARAYIGEDNPEARSRTA